MWHDPAHPRLAPTTHLGPRHSAYSTVCFHVSAYLEHRVTEASVIENLTYNIQYNRVISLCSSAGSLVVMSCNVVCQEDAVHLFLFVPHFIDTSRSLEWHGISLHPWMSRWSLDRTHGKQSKAHSLYTTINTAIKQYNQQGAIKSHSDNMKW